MASDMMVVTGGAGYTGTNLDQALIADGHCFRWP
jgi:nucleoside-diphosphate-sugar epimerase